MSNKENKPLFLFTAIIVILISSELFFTFLTTPKKPTSLNTYVDRNHGFSFQYPANLVTISPDGDLAYYGANIADRIYLQFPISETMASTSGISSFVSFGTLNQATSTCPRLGDGKEKRPNIVSVPAEITINGSLFDTVHWGGCGPTGCLDVFEFSTMHNNRCFKADLEIDGDSPLDQTTPYDLKNMQAEIVVRRLQSAVEQILGTFTFIR